MKYCSPKKQISSNLPPRDSKYCRGGEAQSGVQQKRGSAGAYGTRGEPAVGASRRAERFNATGRGYLVARAHRVDVLRARGVLTVVRDLRPDGEGRQVQAAGKGGDGGRALRAALASGTLYESVARIMLSKTYAAGAARAQSRSV